MAPGRGRCRRQDRRRRRHPRGNSAGLLQGACGSDWPGLERQTSRRRHGVPAQDRSRRAGRLPQHRRNGDPSFRPRHPGLASSAHRFVGNRGEGERRQAGNRAGDDRQQARCRRRSVRDRPLHHPPAHREAGPRPPYQRLLHLLPLLPLAHLQGDVPGRTVDGVLSRPAGRALRVALRHLPPALFDQHLPHLAAGAALPDARPQRRDQHDSRQQELDGESRDAGGERCLRPLQRRALSTDRAGLFRLHGARRRARGRGAGRALRARRSQPADPGRLVQEAGHAGPPPGLLQLLQLRDGALGRPGGHRRDRWDLDPRRDGPQRAAPDALQRHRRRHARRRFRDRHGPDCARRDRGERPPRPGTDDLRRSSRTPALSRPRDQGHARRC